MKKHFILSPVIFLMLFFNHQVLYAQFENKIDSLLLTLRENLSDTTRVRAYNQLSFYILRSQIPLSKIYADSAFALARKIKYIRGEAVSHLRYGNIARIEGNYDSAIQHLNRAIFFFTNIGDSSCVANGLYDLAIINKTIGDYEKSLSYYYRVLKISEAEHNEMSKGNMLNGIGSIYRRLKQYDEAIEKYQEACSIFKNLKKDKLEAMCLNGLGGVYQDMKDFDKAREILFKALKINETAGYKREMAYQLANLGHLFKESGAYQQALQYQLQALDIRKNIPRKEDQALSLFDVGEAYLKTKDYSKSKNYLAQSLLLAKELNSKPLIRDIYHTMAELNSVKGDFEQAYEYHKLYYSYQDSILNEEKTRQINELQTRYETAEKDKKIVILAKEKEIHEKEIQRQATLKNAFIAGGILISIVAGLFVYILFQRLKTQKAFTKKNEEIKEANFRRKMTELEMKALRAQINPHFIFNCMNSINQMILEGNNEPASRYLTKFSKLIRSVLENAESTEVTLHDELNLLETYIQLEALRFDGDIHYRISISKDINPEDIYLPSMVLQPFVENAIWHGLLHNKENNNGVISINISQEGNYLICLIEDNGVGREKAIQIKEKSIWKGKSLGLKITEERLKLLNQEFKQQLIHIIDLKDALGKAQGTRVEISIPIN